MSYPWEWPQERTDRFRALYAEGLTHSVIAKHLGVSRCASIGKAKRLGLAPRKQTNPPKPRRELERRPRKPKFNFARKPGPPVERVKETVGVSVANSPDAPLSLNLTIIEIGANQCRYIAGDDRLMCGHPTVERGHGSYCSHHAAVCYGVQREPS